ncbi:triphosphoribosyl-dephospho-CoA synthase [Cedecea lapagei]|uniref:Probable 2-(5''-triphosphoribosyl)-3'-dephosphocoenzyme-A synthase n=1 Tax=Cedecea lapagei TaxID=158823 RepID=A0A447V5J1_9ENTR|nr:triphosphoribosyl-dephospho-CoA synthase [Cedecea lapagei]
MMPTTQADGRKTPLPRQIVAWYCEKAYQAMLAEVNLSPKPGLVDRDNCGAHRDMTIEDFYRSARVIYRWLARFMEQGALTLHLRESEVLSVLRPVGLACEEAMFNVTAGVNTHKGTLFSLGLVFAAIGRLYAQRQNISPESICSTVAAFCRGLTERELLKHNGMETAGKRLYRQFGLTGARGQAEAGYPLVIELALPHFKAQQAAGSNPDLALLDTLLLLIASNDDTNVASRGGIEGLEWIKRTAKRLLRQGGMRQAANLPRLQRFDRQCIARNLSPGGSADLLIVTWFLAEISSFNTTPTSL